MKQSKPTELREAVGEHRANAVTAYYGTDIGYADRDAGVAGAPTLPLESAFTALPSALEGSRHERELPRVGRISWYQDGPAPGHNRPPLILVHSISASSSAYDVKPIYDHYRKSRCVYALDLPGFGFSARTDRCYTPRLMTDCLLEFCAHVRQTHGVEAVDAIALSLSAEFLARAGVEARQAFRTLGFVNPTGFEQRVLREGPAGSNRGRPWLHRLLERPSWRRSLYELLTRPRVIQYFLRRTFGSNDVDPGLLAYDIASSKPPGAEFAPIGFICGCLFSNDSGRLYRSLAQPVWMVHGNRGAFSKFPGVELMRDRTNWSINTLPTGALPQFERLEEFVALYDSWSARQARPLRP